MPKFLPNLPKPYQGRLDAIVEREATKFSRRAERARKAKRATAEGPKSGEPY